MGTRRVAYVGPFSFPASSAPARRVLGLALSIHSAGYEVVIGAGQRPPAAEHDLPWQIDSLSELPDPRASVVARGFRHFSYGASTIRWLESLAPPPACVVCFGGFVPYLARLLPWCRRAGVPLIIDAVEWYQPSHLPGGVLSPFFVNSEVAMRWMYPQARNIVAISAHLDRYYSRRGCRTLRVPPTLDVKSVEPRMECRRSVMTLVYAGQPGKKDLLDNIIAGVMKVDSVGRHVRLLVVGPTPDLVRSSPALKDWRAGGLPGCVQALGRVNHARAVEVVRSADFTPLLRPRERYAQAGFPTKVPESLAVGTPVICNDTSDLCEYLQDGADSIVSENESADAFAATLDRALSLGRRRRQAMRQAARVTAERRFDYRNYTDKVAEFLGEATICGA